MAFALANTLARVKGLFATQDRCGDVASQRELGLRASLFGGAPPALSGVNGPAEFDDDASLAEHAAARGLSPVEDESEGAPAWHLRLSTDAGTLSLANATIKRCDELLNAQFQALEECAAAPSDELALADLLAPAGITGSPATARGAATSGAGRAGSPPPSKALGTGAPAPGALPLAMSAPIVSTVMPAAPAPAAAAAAGPTASVPEALLGAVVEVEEAFAEARAGGSSTPAGVEPVPAPAPATAAFVLHAPAAWYEDAYVAGAAAEAEGEDGFVPVPSKRGRRRAREEASRRPRQRRAPRQALPPLAARVRRELVLAPAPHGGARKLTARVVAVPDAHTVQVAFTEEVAWVQYPGRVSLPDSSRVVIGAPVLVTATDVKCADGAWFLQCAPVTAAAPQPAAAPVPPVAAKPAAGTAAVPAPSAAPSTAPAATTKRRTFNVNAAAYSGPAAPLVQAQARAAANFNALWYQQQLLTAGFLPPLAQPLPAPPAAAPAAAPAASVPTGTVRILKRPTSGQ